MSGINIDDMNRDMGIFAGAFSEGSFDTNLKVESVTGMSSNADTYYGPSGP